MKTLVKSCNCRPGVLSEDAGQFLVPIILASDLAVVAGQPLPGVHAPGNKTFVSILLFMAFIKRTNIKSQSLR